MYLHAIITEERNENAKDRTVSLKQGIQRLRIERSAFYRIGHNFLYDKQLYGYNLSLILCNIDFDKV